MFCKSLRAYCSCIEYLVSFVGRSISVLMPMIALVIAFEVFSRYFINAPTIWAYDLSLFLSSYMAALGGAYAQQKRSHINVDILYISVSTQTKAVFRILSTFLAAFFMCIIILVSYQKFQEAVNFNYRRMSEWAPPMHHFWLMLISAASLVLLQNSSDLIKDLFRLFTGNRLFPKVNENDEAADGH